MNQFNTLRSFGNIFTLSLSLYRHHFWQNLKLSFIAYLWLLIPLYGWAKHQKVLAIISRLAWYRLNSDLEHSKADIHQFSKVVSGRSFSFLMAHFLVIILNFVKLSFSFISTISIFTILGIINFIMRRSYAPFIVFDSLADFPWFRIIVTFIILLLIALALFWFYTQFFMFEAILAIEKDSSIWQSITKSWRLKKRAFFQTQGLIILLLTLTTQILMFLNIGLAWLFSLGLMTFNFTNETEDLLLIIYIWIMTLITVIFLQPVWQNAKTILYFNLQNMHQGLDLLRIQRFDEQENKFS